MRHHGSAAALLTSLLLVSTTLVHADDEPQITFARAYVRQLGDMESSREDGEREMQKPGNNQVAEGLAWNERIKIYLNTGIRTAQSLHFGNENDDGSVMQLVTLDEAELQIHDQLADIATVFLAGPKPGVDYGSLMAKMPKLRVQLQETDKLYMNMSALVFATLIDKQPDASGHMSRLRITKAERTELLTMIKRRFGARLDAKEPTSITNAAWVLRSYLSKEKGYKCSDEA
jgi:hypothetical protein